MNTYSIYILINPKTEHPFYVGQSIRPDFRRYQHQNDAKALIKANAQTSIYTPIFYKYLIQNRIIPRLEVIETIESDNKKEIACLENYWIWQFRSWGFDIVNIKK
jgi:hypothetical protein